MYSPKIREELVIKLYRHKLEYPESKPMTWFVNEAIQKYLRTNGGSDVTNKRMVLGPKKRRTNSNN
jgi:hypothetical protein